MSDTAEKRIRRKWGLAPPEPPNESALTSPGRWALIIERVTGQPASPALANSLAEDQVRRSWGIRRRPR